MPQRFLALLTSAALLCACRQGDDSLAGKPLEAAAKARERSRVLVEQVGAREMVRVLETTTKIESEHQVDIYPRASGILIELLAEEGDIVQADQVLARLDDRDARIAVSDAEVALEESRALLPKLELAVREAETRGESAKRSAEQATRDYDRNAAISLGSADRPGLLSAKDLEQSRLQRDSTASEHATAMMALERARIEHVAGKNAIDRASLALDRARLTLSYTDVRAPFRGVIAERAVKVGDSVSPSTKAFVLTDPDNLRAVFYRPQRELALFRGATSDNGKGMLELELTAESEALPGVAFHGTIERIAPTIDPQSGAFRVTARMQVTPKDAAGPRLLPGMLVRLAVITERRPDSLSVPKRAILREGEISTIVVVRDGKALRIHVEEGLSDDQHVEVRALGDAGLALGDTVVVVGNRDLENGAEVEIDAPKAAAQ